MVLYGLALTPLSGASIGSTDGGQQSMPTMQPWQGRSDIIRRYGCSGAGPGGLLLSREEHPGHSGGSMDRAKGAARRGFKQTSSDTARPDRQLRWRDATTQQE
jgi:hypothetical protein